MIDLIILCVVLGLIGVGGAVLSDSAGPKITVTCVCGRNAARDIRVCRLSAGDISAARQLAIQALTATCPVCQVERCLDKQDPKVPHDGSVSDAAI